MRKAIDLVDHGLHVEQVVALDVAEVGGPAVVESVVDLGHRIATRKLRKRYWIRIDLRSVKIIHTCAAGAIRPFVGGMLIDPGRGAAIGFDDFENRVDLQILMRENGGAIFGRVARKKIWIDAAAAVEQGQIEIDGFVIGRRGADDAGAQARAAGDGQ